MMMTPEKNEINSVKLRTNQWMDFKHFFVINKVKVRYVIWPEKFVLGGEVHRNFKNFKNWNPYATWKRKYCRKMTKKKTASEKETFSNRRKIPQKINFLLQGIFDLKKIPFLQDPKLIFKQFCIFYKIHPNFWTVEREVKKFSNIFEH